MSDQAPDRPLITEDWLRSVGFKWAQFDRQPEKHWILWLGDAIVEPGPKSLWRFSDFEDLGLELAENGTLKIGFNCWLRADTEGRYHRFIHIRNMEYQGEVISLAEGLTGQRWDPANNLYGMMRSPEHAAAMREEEEKRKERADLRALEQRTVWYEHEKDPDRSRPLAEHVDAARKGGLAK